MSDTTDQSLQTIASSLQVIIEQLPLLIGAISNQEKTINVLNSIDNSIQELASITKDVG